jgi:hypothetical protein
VLKIGLVLGKKFLKSFLFSFIRARLIYLIGSSLLGYIEEINFLLKSYNLDYYILNIIIITNTRGG